MQILAVVDQGPTHGPLQQLSLDGSMAQICSTGHMGPALEVYQPNIGNF